MKGKPRDKNKDASKSKYGGKRNGSIKKDPQKPTGKVGSAEPEKGKPEKRITRDIVKNYRDRGYDVGPKGKPDWEKVKIIHEALEKAKADSKPKDETVKDADTRLKQVRAEILEIQRDEKAGVLVRRDVVIAQQVRRESQLVKGFLGLIHKIPPQVAGQDINTVQRIMEKEVHRILDKFVKSQKATQ